MAVIQPFRALRPQADIADQVASKPYDVLNRKEARDEAEGNPYSFYHISKSEIDLPASVDLHDKAVYDKARENLEIFRKKGFLLLENKPCYYIYQLEMKGRRQTGLVAVSCIDDYEKGVIRKHELTRPEKEQDRIDHILATRAHTGNVFLAYHAPVKLKTLIEEQKEEKDPVYDFVAGDQVRHSVWVIDNKKVVDKMTGLFASEVPATYIADGHHRAASAAKVAQRLSGGKVHAELPSSFFLTTLFPDDELQIMDYNRVVKDLGRLNEKEFLSGLEYTFKVARVGDTRVKPAEPHEFGMYMDGSWYRLVAEPASYTTDPIGILDVTILQNNVLDKLLDIKNPRTDRRIDFIGGIRGLGELEKKVDRGEMKVAFAVHPVTLAQLFEIADTGEIMPPKSTWFEPKLRDGLFTHLI